MDVKFRRFVPALFCLMLVYSWPAAAEQSEDLNDLLNANVEAASKYDQPIREAPASVSIITREDIQDFGYQTLEEALASLPGVYTSVDQNYGYLGVRGFSRPTDYNNRILLLINGHPMNENFYGFASIWTDLAIDMNSLERIEFVRGPGSSLYGTGAMLGIINLITRDASELSAIEASVTTGSFQNLGAKLRIGKEFSDSKLFVSVVGQDVAGENLYFREFDSPETNSGVAEHSNWDRWYGALATYDHGTVSLQGGHTWRSKGIPTGAYSTDFDSTSASTLDERQFIEARWNFWSNSSSSVSAIGSYNRYHYKGSYPGGGSTYRDENVGQWLGSELRWQWDTAADNRFIAGTEFVRNVTASYKSFDELETYSDSNYPYSVFSFYIQDEYQLFKNLGITAGIRYDNVLKGSAISPRFAVIHHPSLSSTLKFLYGHAFRSPNLYEVHYDDAGYKANPFIKPEQMRTAEFIWEQSVTRTLQSRVSLYRYSMKRLIDVDSNQLSLNTFINKGEVLATGLEAEILARFPNGIHGHASYSYQKAVDQESDLLLTNAPQQLIKLSLAVPLSGSYRLSSELQYQDARKTVYDSFTKPAVLANIGIRGNLPFLSTTNELFQKLHLSFFVKNVFDTDYSAPGGVEHIMPSIPQQGRNFLLTLDFQFNVR